MYTRTSILINFALLNDLAKEYLLKDYFYVQGAECSPNLVIYDKDKKLSFEYRTVFYIGDD